MTYESPELVLVGSVSAVVLGEFPGNDDAAGDPDTERTPPGITLGLD